MSESFSLPPRKGPRPETLGNLPHSQLTQHGPDDVIQRLHDWCFALPGINNEPSGISVPGSRAMIVKEDFAGNPAAFMIGREFAHIHPKPDNGSMHLMLPPDEARAVVDTGWGEDHYLVTQGHLPPGLIMLFSPRDEAELDVVTSIVARSYSYATGGSGAG